MGIFDGLLGTSRNSGAEVVKWMGSPDEIVWRYPSEELATWSQLVVNESQEAFLVRGGVYEGPFGPGRHTLSTENIPILAKLIGLPFGKKSPFTAEVWFVNKVSNLNIRWGTPDAIQLQDPKFQTMIPVRAFGKYAIKVSNSKKFLLKLAGTQQRLEAGSIQEYFRGIFITRIKTQIARAIISRGFSVLEVSTELEQLSGDLKTALFPYMDEYGLELLHFDINSINVPEDDPAISQLKSALAKRAEMNIVGYNYQQERSFDVMNAAASNEGNAGSVLGAGLGLGMGVAMGGPMGATMGNLVPNLQTGQAGQPINPNTQQPAPQGQNAGSPNEITKEKNITSETRIQMLKDLAELKASGILTDDEFNSEKQRILSL
jgi:membrane protease subunit (stomatin/prohibitin family)